jgi:hypothetical protein
MTLRSRRWLTMAGFLCMLGLLVLLGEATAAAVGREGLPVAGHARVAALAQESATSLATTLVVTSTTDSGPGTLRQAMLDAASGDTITFDPAIFPPSNPMTVSVTSPLPPVAQGDLTIDASAAGVILDGSTLADGSGLQITSNGNAIQGLRVQNFPRSGIVLHDGASFNLIGGTNATPGAACSGACNLISGNDDNGVEVIGAGTMSNTVRNVFHGVVIDSGAGGNVVGGTSEAGANLISGNGSMAVFIRNSSDNQVLGNLVGTDASGMSPLPNVAGMGIYFAAKRNLLENNVIAGNDFYGVQIALPDATDNVVRSNWIGTNPQNHDLGNTWGGIELTSGAGHNTIGPDNVIRYNDGSGVTINHGGHDNLLTANEIAYNTADGVEVDGMDALSNTITVNSIYSNGELGIILVDGGNTELPAPVVLAYDVDAGTAHGTACAGCTVEVFSDDGEEGRWFEGEDVAEAGTWSLSKGSSFTGSHVHATVTDPSGNTSEFSLTLGTCPLVSTPEDSGPSTLRRCLETAVAGQLITFDTGVFPPNDPVTITLLSELPDIVADSLTIDGSDAGVILDGSQIGLVPEAVLLDDVSLSLAGGPDVLENGDFSAGLGHWRPWDERPGVTRTLSYGDFHTSAPSYEWEMVARQDESGLVYDTTDRSDPLDGSADTTWITATSGSSVDVSFWYRYGGIRVILYVLYPDGDDETNPWEFGWTGEWTRAEVHAAVPEGATAIALEFRYRHSEEPVAGFTIRSSGNAVRGLQVVNFPDIGVWLAYGAQHNTIGGDRNIGDGPLGQGNLISGNDMDGIKLSGTDTMNNTIRGNYIGTDVTGSRARGNRGDGVAFVGASNNFVGGGAEGTRNLISGNYENGVSMKTSETTGNTISGNYIGTDSSGTVAIPNQGSGVGMSKGPNHNLIGGHTEAERNIIAGNIDDGIHIGSGSEHNTLSGNFIGIGPDGVTVVPNGYYGINIGSSYNTIGGLNGSPGGACSGACNLIAGNRYGLQIAGSLAISNTVTGNYIGTDVKGITAIPSIAAEYSNNLQIGGAQNRIGGTTPGERNVMVGPTWIAPPYAAPEHNSIVGNYVGLDATGTACIANGYSGIGVWGSGHVIGGDTAAEGNRICGYDHHGISISASGCVVAHNEIHGHGEEGVLIGGSDNVVEQNEIYGNGGDGVEVRGGMALRNTIAENSIYQNTRKGIHLEDGGNSELPAPVVLAYDVDAGTASGTTCAGCVVEFFSDDADEGRVLEGVTETVTTTWTFAKVGGFTGPYIRATATDAQGNTSEFSRAWHDIAVVGATPLGMVQVGQDVGVTAELLNQGSDTENDVPVRCSIADPASTTVYSMTQESGAVPAGTYAVLAFSAWTPSAAGSHLLTCQSMLPGDEVTDNDVYTRVMTATLVGAPDVWTKDNEEDTGDVPSRHPWWVSPDLWVRHQPDGGLVHENPTVGVTNTIYVRLRNRGEQVASGDVGVYWDRSRISWPCKVDGPNIGTIPFEDLAPGEVRIVSLPWLPQEPGHHGVHTVIEAEGDPADWSAPCSPHRPRWDNNVSWHNVIAYYHPTTILQQTLAVEEAVVGLVNVYDLPKDLDLIVQRGTFPAGGTITLQFGKDLFDRWLVYEGRWKDGVAVITATGEFTVTGEISATIGGLPLEAGEEATATLVFEAPDEGEFEVALQERIDGLTVGGVTYRWSATDIVPPEVVAHSPLGDAEEVALNAPIVITFTEEIGPLSLGLTMSPTLDLGSAAWGELGTVVTVTHGRFAPGTIYTATVTASDAFANPMVPPYTWSFTTREGGFIYLPLVMRNR